MFPSGWNYPGRVRDKTQTNSAGAGERLIRAGAIVFFLGAVATMITVAPLLLGTEVLPSYMYGLCMLMGVGFLLAAAGVLRTVAEGRRRARDASRQGA
ncbi:hypothetical protein QFZ63_004465 [Streptomyces sp. B3I7]|nr:hypothetical protein [Streptomyces sp. B3I8]MDQ0812751.1 hypothetical protein [Streptomyces sp. B3I7]